MSNYLVLTIETSPEVGQLLMAELADIGFEGFLELDNGFEAYIAESDANEIVINELLAQYLIDPSSVQRSIQVQQNWNASWEESFEPVEIDQSVRIRAPFHDPVPGFDNELVIQPKTSFGTGHHETTFLVIQLMMEAQFHGKTVLDFGSGTGILAILAAKLGSTSIFAIDIDDWAAENISENAALNAIECIHFEKGGLERLKNEEFDFILANINKNVLLHSFQSLSQHLQEAGVLLISGFFTTDLQDLLAEANRHGLHLLNQKNRNEWCAATLGFNLDKK